VSSATARAFARWAGQQAAVLLGFALLGCAAVNPSSPAPFVPLPGEMVSGEPDPGVSQVAYRESAVPAPDSPAPKADTAPPQADRPPPSSTAPGNPEMLRKESKEEETEKKIEGGGPDKTAEKKEPWYSVHGQGTIVTQQHDHFRSPYVGPNSLLPIEPSATTETATLFLDARIWPGGEIVFNPEIAGGRGLSGTTGLAGFSNGEATRVGVLEPTPYIARLFFRQTWGLDVEREKVEDGPNQLASVRDKDRFTVTVGKMSATDVFDANRYSHDPRTQFLDWALMFNGAWDYPANVRGYTYGVVLDFTTIFYAVRYGIFAEPAEANGAALDPRILKANGQILEFEQSYCIDDRPGKLREWASLNHAHMGKYREALELMPVDPDVTLTRAYRFKYGFGVNVEQELTRELGAFARAGWNDGHSESWAFTEIDRSVALGLVLKGYWWHRKQDEVGLAVVINGLSPDHRDYLRAGGVGFIIGDGRLNYAPEQILETYYNWELVKGIYVTADFQAVRHPAYNADRGPVAIGTLRVHLEH
jgi:high affinity Mn2+ porin